MNVRNLGLLLLVTCLLFSLSCSKKDIAETKLLLTRNEVLESEFPSNVTPTDAVKRYVRAQFTRNTEELRAAITKDLSDEMGVEFYDPSFGVSSPWVERAEIVQQNGASTNKWRYSIKYWMANSQGIIGTKKEYVEVIEINKKYYVDNITTKI